MKKALFIIAATSCVALVHAQHGQLNLITTDVGEGGNNVYFAGSCLMQFAPDSTQQDGSAFDAYCTVLNVDAVVGSTWGATQLNTTQFVPSPNDTVVPSSDYAQTGSEIAWLANTYGVTSSNEQAAATQVAIWDLAEGGDGNANDLFFNGEIASWSFGDNTIADAQTFASNAISAYNSGARDVDTWYQADVYTNNDGSVTHESQDFVTPGATPEPVTMSLGIAGIGLAIRRRLKKTA